MGLDNGLYLHTRRDMKEVKKPTWLELDFWDSDEGGDWEIAYWRGNHGVQNLGHEVFKDFDNCSPSELKEFSEKLCGFLMGEREWDCGWDLEECFGRLGRQIAAISWIANWLEEEPNARVEFVDSY